MHKNKINLEKVLAALNKEWGALAMASTAGVGTLFGTVL
jgi:hypothetical protein